MKNLKNIDAPEDGIFKLTLGAPQLRYVAEICFTTTGGGGLSWPGGCRLGSASSTPPFGRRGGSAWGSEKRFASAQSKRPLSSETSWVNIIFLREGYGGLGQVGGWWLVPNLPDPPG